MLNKIGIILRDTLQSQCNFSVINAINCINQSGLSSVSLFNIVMTPSCVRTMCCSTTIDKIWGFKGGLVANDVETARFLLRHNSSVKNWYIWDLEWLRNRYMVEDMKHLHNPNIFNITCRSIDHAKAIAEFSGHDVNMFSVEPNYTKYILERVDNGKRNG